MRRWRGLWRKWGARRFYTAQRERRSISGMRSTAFGLRGSVEGEAEVDQTPQKDEGSEVQARGGEEFKILKPPCIQGVLHVLGDAKKDGEAGPEDGEGREADELATEQTAPHLVGESLVETSNRRFDGEQDSQQDYGDYECHEHGMSFLPRREGVRCGGMLRRKTLLNVREI